MSNEAASRTMNMCSFARRNFLPVLFVLLTSGAMAAGLMSPIPSGTDEIVFQDEVSEDLVTPATRNSKEVYKRVVTRTDDNTFVSHITDRNGMPRMTGSYKDIALKVPDGEFTYFYSNGRVESTGRFTNGIKSGTWHCWQSDGTPRADRYYQGQDWDHMQVTLGVAERATTLNSVKDVPASTATTTAIDTVVAPPQVARQPSPKVRSLPSKSKGFLWKRTRR